jgi:signal transduction histidine kinase
LADLSERFSPPARSAGSTLEILSAPKVVGYWDRFRLEHLLSCVLTNAIKYGRGRPIGIALAADEEMVRISIRDQGVGIAREDTTRIFNRFEQAGESRKYGGLGLGLYLAQQIAEAHGGSIVVRSTLGRGSNFIVILPRDCSGESQPRTKSDKPVPKSHERISAGHGSTVH